MDQITIGDIVAIVIAALALIGAIYPTISGKRKSRAEVMLLSLEAQENMQRQINDLRDQLQRVEEENIELRRQNERQKTEIMRLKRRVRELENGNGKHE